MELISNCILLIAMLVIVDVRSDGASEENNYLMKLSDSLTRSLERAKRTSNSPSINVSLSLASEDAGSECPNGNTAGLGRTTLRLEYRIQQAGESDPVPWKGIEEMDDIPLDSGEIQFSIPDSPSDNDDVCVQFRLVQEEHGGGYCNCWSVQNPRVRSNVDTFKILRTEGGSIIQTCPTSASVRRILTCTYCNNDTSDNSNLCTNMADSDPPLRTPFNISVSSDLHGILSNACTETEPRLHVHFRVLLRGQNSCNQIEHTPNVAIEFSLRFENEIWVPLTVIHGDGSSRSNGLPLGDFDNLVIRDYQTENQVLVPHLTDQNVSMELCNFVRVPNNIQFRWLQTNINSPSTGTFEDIWGIDDLKISFAEANEEEEVVMLYDLFDENKLNSTVWPIEGRRDVNLSTMCTIGNQALTFGLNSVNYGAARHVSRSIFTGLLSTDNTMPEEIETTTSSEPSTATSSPLQMVNSLVLSIINENSELAKVIDGTFREAVVLLGNLTARKEPPDPAVSLYLLGDILNGFNSSTDSSEMLVQSSLEICENLIVSATNSQVKELITSLTVIGSSLLSVIERIALKALPEMGNYFKGNIAIRTTQILSARMGDDYFTAIQSSTIDSSLPLLSIQLPLELITKFAGEKLKVISSFIYNAENLFPKGENNSVLGSGIVSTSLQCGDILCDTRSANLENPVIITMEHSSHVNQNQNFNAACVYWNFSTEGSGDDLPLTSGQWSTDGCSRNKTLSNASLTVCECTHLTHFAVLLSPVPFSHDQIPLEAISVIGVIISLVSMAITVITFIMLRSLRNMRTYIHINLCINLMIAQLIFIVGIDRSADDHVPVHCQAIAVLLHYFFLVSFMWMLMEGVVLYFILIKVFVTNTKKLILGFTTVSYGIPLLYMGLLTLPLGFILPNKHYGSTYACFLNAKTRFIWAFIAPVLAIMLINIGFFIMAGVALWHQRKNQKGKMDRKNILVWLKALSLLLLIMGLTWVFGILVVDHALLPLAYVHASLVAFQGFFIFLSTVAFQKTVRDEYLKSFRENIEKSERLSTLFNISASVSTKGLSHMKQLKGERMKNLQSKKAENVPDEKELGKSEDVQCKEKSNQLECENCPTAKYLIKI